MVEVPEEVRPQPLAAELHQQSRALRRPRRAYKPMVADLAGHQPTETLMAGPAEEVCLARGMLVWALSDLETTAVECPPTEAEAVVRVLLEAQVGLTTAVTAGMAWRGSTV